MAPGEGNHIFLHQPDSTAALTGGQPAGGRGAVVGVPGWRPHQVLLHHHLKVENEHDDSSIFVLHGYHIHQAEEAAPCKVRTRAPVFPGGMDTPPPEPEGACPLLTPPRLPSPLLPPCLASGSCPTPPPPATCQPEPPPRWAAPTFPFQSSPFLSLCWPCHSCPLSPCAFSPHCLLLLSSYTVASFPLCSHVVSLLFLRQDGAAQRGRPDFKPRISGSRSQLCCLITDAFSSMFTPLGPHFPHLENGNTNHSLLMSCDD